MRRIVLVFALAGLLLPLPARADLILSFSADGTNNPTFFVNVGQQIQIPIYIVERNQAPFTTDLSTFGLVNAGVRVDYTNLIAGGGQAVTGTMTPPGWFQVGTYPIVVNGPTTGHLDISGGTVGGAAMTTGTPPAIQFGTLTFQGNTVGDIMSLSTTNTHPSSYAEFVSGGASAINFEHQPYGNIFWPSGDPANGNLHYMATITVTPEPTLILCVGIPAVGYVAWRRRKKID